MATLSFYLDKRNKKRFKRVYFNLSHQSKQYKNSLGESIDINDWEKKKNFLKSTARNKHHILLRKKLIDLVNFVNVEVLIENPKIPFELLKGRFLDKIGKGTVHKPQTPADLIQAHEMYANRLESHKYTKQTINRFKRNAHLLEMFLDESGYEKNIKS